MILHYMGYEGSVEYDCESKVYFGKIININENVHYRNDTQEGLIDCFIYAVEDYMDAIQYH